MGGEHDTTRRRYLRAVGAASALAVAGCSDTGSASSCRDPSTFSSTIGVAAADALDVVGAETAWPFRNRDARNTGATPDPGPRERVVRGWEFEATVVNSRRPPENCYPVIADGRVYIGIYDGSALVALDPATGDVRWRYDRLTSGGVPAVLGSADDRLVVAPGANGLHGVDAATGQRRWVYDDGSFDHDGNVVAADGAVFANGRNGIHAVEIGRGEKRWVADGTQVGAAVDGILVLGDDPLRALDTADGSVIWDVSDTAPYGSVAVRDGSVYVGELGRVESYSLEGGVWEWGFEGETEDFGVPTVTEDRVVVASTHTEVAGGNLYAIDRATGEREWCRAYGGRDVLETVVADGVVYVAAGDVLEAVSVADGSRVWTLREQYGGYETPAVTGNLLVVGRTDGTVTAIGEGASSGPVPTPTPADTPPTPPG